jgi:hypothetical protein
MLDPEQPTALRLKAAEIILDKTLPKNAAQITLGTDDDAGPRMLEIRIVEADSTTCSYDEFVGQRRRGEAVDRQSVVTLQPQLSPPRTVWEDEQATICNNGKVPSLRARNAAGIFRWATRTALS